MTSDENIEPCPHRPTCPGCPRYAESGIAPNAEERLRALALELGAELDASVADRAEGHRHRARLMVRGRAASPKVGLFQSGSHRIVDIPTCRVQHPVVNLAARALKQAIRATASPPYADAPHRGLVRALQVVVERESQRAQLVLVTNGASSALAQPLLERLARELEGHLHSLWWNGNPERTNVILGGHWEQILGPEAVRERIGGADVFFPPGAFGQSHLPLADRIVEHVHACVDPTQRVAELHAGCGAIGLGLLARGQAVGFNEISPAGLRGLELGLAAQASDARLRALVWPGPASDAVSALRDRDVVVVDPPRRGLEPALLAGLLAAPPQRIVYVSCDVGSLARDANALVADGLLALRQLTPYVLFPFTEHVETVAIFERA